MVQRCRVNPERYAPSTCRKLREAIETLLAAVTALVAVSICAYFCCVRIKCYAGLRVSRNCRVIPASQGAKRMNFPIAIIISAALLSAAIIARPAISQNTSSAGMIVPIVGKNGATEGVWELYNGHVRKCWLGDEFLTQTKLEPLPTPTGKNYFVTNEKGHPRLIWPWDRKTLCNKWSDSK